MVSSLRTGSWSPGSVCWRRGLEPRWPSGDLKQRPTRQAVAAIWLAAIWPFSLRRSAHVTGTSLLASSARGPAFPWRPRSPRCSHGSRVGDYLGHVLDGPRSPVHARPRAGSRDRDEEGQLGRSREIRCSGPIRAACSACWSCPEPAGPRNSLRPCRGVANATGRLLWPERSSAVRPSQVCSSAERLSDLARARQAMALRGLAWPRQRE
jgi:hypothetical protein